MATSRTIPTGTPVTQTITDGDTTHAPSGDAVFDALAGKDASGSAAAAQSYAIQRSNHTGTQAASTISDFASTVRSTLLTGLSTATNAAIAATDTVLQALGKLQAQVSAIASTVSGLVVSTITNGDTTHAPSADAVHDALAGKGNLGGGNTWEGDQTSYLVDGPFQATFATYAGSLSSDPSIRSLFNVDRYNGTPGAETAVLRTNELGTFQFRGYDGTSVTPSSARLTVIAREDFAVGAHGAQFIFQAAPVGSAFAGFVFRVDSDRISPGGDNASDIGAPVLRWKDTYSAQFRPGAGTTIWTSGSGSPEGAITAPVGSLYTRTDGGAGSTLYVKESGSGNTGWVAK